MTLWTAPQLRRLTENRDRHMCQIYPGYRHSQAGQAQIGRSVIRLRCFGVEHLTQLAHYTFTIADAHTYSMRLHVYVSRYIHILVQEYKAKERVRWNAEYFSRFAFQMDILMRFKLLTQKEEKEDGIQDLGRQVVEWGG
ncbi:hypothetical protein ALC57_17030 [Trachymyrmex cornetzi]|uniref:Uncharacterized protein n=1 Tax=Trachymyrmex cornetzi TaxID=471704 RepID=A0A195DD48_9HYME|nr:hypothetical protein ALC57_17030 [Trachymyrmex cornetzi]